MASRGVTSCDARRVKPEESRAHSASIQSSSKLKGACLSI